MKTRIETLEKAYEEHRYYAEDLPMNRTLQSAYMTSLEAGNDHPDFSEVIWDEDIEAILADCKTYGINGIHDFEQLLRPDQNHRHL